MFFLALVFAKIAVNLQVEKESIDTTCDASNDETEDDFFELLAAANRSNGADSVGKRSNGLSLGLVPELDGETEPLMEQLKEENKKYVELDLRLSSALDPSARADIEEQLMASGARFNALKEQLKLVQGSKQAVNHQLEKRKKIVMELVETEHGFASDLRACIAGYRGVYGLQANEFDLTNLFGNFDEVAAVAAALDADFLAAGADDGADPSKWCVGQPFCDHAQQLSEAYIRYCVHFEDASALLIKYDADPEKKAKLQQCHSTIRETKVWDLNGFLIKPVQRVLKYPLLLKELFSKTDEAHPDYQALKAALEKMLDLATEINEAKRKKELLSKYQGGTDQKGGGFMHSFAKKSMRINQKMTNKLTFSTKTVDQDKYARFAGLEVQTKDLEKNARKLQKRSVEQVEAINGAYRSLKDFAGATKQLALNSFDGRGDTTIEKTCGVLADMEIIATAYSDTITTRVTGVLTSFLSLFEGPLKLIAKRADKRLDFESYTRKFRAAAKDSEKQRMLKKDLDLSRNNFEALNDQLEEDLPTFIRGCRRLLSRITLTAVQARHALARDSAVACAKVCSGCVGDPREKITHDRNRIIKNALERFLSDAVSNPNAWMDGLSGFRDPPFDPFVVPSKSKSSNPESLASNATGTFGSLSRSLERSESHRNRAPRAPALTKRDPIDDGGALTRMPQQPSAAQEVEYCTSKWDFKACSATEVSVTAGMILRLIKRSDTTGNKEWWNVEKADGTKGFVPEAYLEVCPPPAPTLRKCTAAYDFEASTSSELSVVAGSTLIVVALTDQNGQSSPPHSPNADFFFWLSMLGGEMPQKTF